MGLRLGFAVCNLSVARRERDVLKAHMIFATPPIGIALRALCYPILCLTQGIFGGQIPYVTSLFLHVASRRRWRAWTVQLPTGFTRAGLGSPAEGWCELHRWGETRKTKKSFIRYSSISRLSTHICCPRPAARGFANQTFPEIMRIGCNLQQPTSLSPQRYSRGAYTTPSLDTALRKPFGWGVPFANSPESSFEEGPNRALQEVSTNAHNWLLHGSIRD